MFNLPEVKSVYTLNTGLDFSRFKGLPKRTKQWARMFYMPTTNIKLNGKKIKVQVSHRGRAYFRTERGNLVYVANVQVKEKA